VGLLAFGLALLTSGEARGVLWAVLALLTALLGRRRHPGSLWSFAALLAWGGALSSELMRGIWQALASRDPVAGPLASPGSLAVLALIVLAYLATVPPARLAVDVGRSWGATRVPAALLLFLGSAGLAAIVVRALRPFTADLARLATARTVVAVAVALSLALVLRRLACPELKWIAYLALVLGGVVLVVQGLPSGQPLLLLISFVVYGAGLIAVPRLAPPGRQGASSSGPG